MESFESKVRLRPILGKYPVSAVDKVISGWRVTLQLPGVKLIMDLPEFVDVRVGDILTLFTEVLTHANSNKPPEQYHH
jgi:hypothetical protein